MIVRLINGDTIDTEFPRVNNKYKKIDITGPGIVVHWATSGYRIFYPWHRVEFVSGEYGEFEHELEQFNYLGIASDG